MNPRLRWGDLAVRVGGRRVPPHPGPLPWGEGGRVSPFVLQNQVHGFNARRFCFRRSLSPSLSSIGWRRGCPKGGRGSAGVLREDVFVGGDEEAAGAAGGVEDFVGGLGVEAGDDE